MTFHLFGNVLTHHGAAANNRGETEGTITTLQKLFWHGDVHSTVSAEAIRWALRYHWQILGDGHQVNRQWSDAENDNKWQADFNDEVYIDDDVLGYMKAEGAKIDASDPQNAEGAETDASDPPQKNAGSKKTAKKPKEKGTATVKRGVLEVTRAVSLLPFAGDVTFNAKSGQKGRTSLYATEVHATRYQYGFACTPSRLKVQARVIAVLDGLMSLGEVAGNQSRFFYDFSPESVVLRWTHDFSPRFLYCFAESEPNKITVNDLVQRVESGDINPSELWVAGSIARSEEGEKLKQLGAKVVPGVIAAVAALKTQIRQDLNLPQE